MGKVLQNINDDAHELHFNWHISYLFMWISFVANQTAIRLLLQ